MKMRWTAAICAMFLLLPLGLFAASKNSARVSFSDPITVSGKELASGDYQLKWDGESGPVQVSFIQNKKVVATAAATIVQEKTGYENAVETRKGSDNVLVLQAIEWKNKVLNFDQGTSPAHDTGAE